MRLNRLYMENYKCFKSKEVDFSDNDLFVLGDPNGFGKTSIFEAIELIITGQIKRISESLTVKGFTTFKTNCLANDSNKRVIIKAEFQEKDGTKFTIARVFQPNQANSSYNPAKLFNTVETYRSSKFENIITEHNVVDNEVIEFEKVSEFYDMLYYVKQEDRLHYLKSKEDARLNRIDSLFDLDNHNKKVNQLKQLRALINKKLKALESELNTLEDRKKTNISPPSSDIIPDSSIFKDKNEFGIDSLNNQVSIKDLERYLSDITYFKLLINKKNIFQEQLKYKEINKILKQVKTNNKRNIFYKLAIKDIPLKEIIKYYENKQKLDKNITLLQSHEYNNLDLKFILEFFSIDNKSTLIMEANNIINAERKSQSLDSINKKIIDARKQLSSIIKNSNDSKCIYCGYDWEDEEKLKNQINSVTDDLVQLCSEGEKDIMQKKESFTDKVMLSISVVWNEFLATNQPISEDEFLKINSITIEEEYNEFIGFYKKLKPIISEHEKESLNFNQFLVSVEDQISILKSSIELTDYEKCKVIFNKYFNSSFDALAKISITDVIQKEKYIKDLIYRIEFLDNEKIFIEIESAKLVNNNYKKSLDKIKEMETLYKIAIHNYQKSVIKDIEIPFYIITGKVLQYHQMGLGIVIKESEESLYTGIKFVPLNEQEHDIQYTMSSGQLSAIIIANSLVMNKVFADKFDTIFIDDPVQTMDELNCASLVELLRREFANKQIIVSTHEDNFANYIRYKYEKLNLSSKLISLKS